MSSPSIGGLGGQVTSEFIQEPQDREQYLEEATGKSREQCHHQRSGGRREALNYAQGHYQLSLQSTVNSFTCYQGPAYILLINAESHGLE